MSKLDLIVEIGAEEVPAGYIEPALAAMKERLLKALADRRLATDDEPPVIKTWATPRRLAFGVWGIEAAQPKVITEKAGPPVDRLRDDSGAWTKAAVGFAKSMGVELEDLILDQGPRAIARKEEEARTAREVLPEVMEQLILGLPFPKSMRWGMGEVTFVRPIHWILAVLGGEVLPMRIGAIEAGNVSYGHRFLHPGPVEITSPDDYIAKMREAGVSADAAERRETVRSEVARAAAEAGPGFVVVEDEELVDEVANLVELPVAGLGRFDDVFLKLPKEVVITAMREHQRYFAMTDKEGRLAPFFIAVNNTRARDMSVVAKGHERVLRARLEDAGFYFKEDRKASLESKQDELKKVVFHNRLGTSWEKVERFSTLAGHLADLLDPPVKADLLRAASLCKCDLVTGVVGEFPSLQGLMGREYALRDSEPEEVAQAIYEHYLPVRAGGGLPQTSAGALLSLADKLDTICGCFGVGLIPTGAADPFALRRQALGIINIILDRGYRLSLASLVDKSLGVLAPWLKKPAFEVREEVLEFFRLRLKNQLTGQGVSTDGAEAVLSLHCDDLVASAARVAALEEIKKRDDFADLAVAFKRVVNIIRKFGAGDAYDPALTEPEQEKALAEAVGRVEEEAKGLMAADDYQGLLAAIVGLKPTVDAFFDHVLVDDPDPKVKANRLALLARASGLFENVADFSKLST